MTYATAAELQVLLEGVPLPAKKQELLSYAQQQDAEPRLLAALRSIPDGKYRRLDQVGEQLVRAQPSRDMPQPGTPKAESGAVPGGKAYTDGSREPGSVRDAQGEKPGD